METQTELSRAITSRAEPSRTTQWKSAIRSAVATATPWLRHCCTDEPSDHNIEIAHLKGWGIKQPNHFNLGIESRWCLNHVRDL